MVLTRLKERREKQRQQAKAYALYRQKYYELEALVNRGLYAASAIQSTDEAVITAMTHSLTQEDLKLYSSYHQQLEHITATILHHEMYTRLLVCTADEGIEQIEELLQRLNSIDYTSSIPSVTTPGGRLYYFTEYAKKILEQYRQRDEQLYDGELFAFDNIATDQTKLEKVRETYSYDPGEALIHHYERIVEELQVVNPANNEDKINEMISVIDTNIISVTPMVNHLEWVRYMLTKEHADTDA